MKCSNRHTALILTAGSLFFTTSYTHAFDIGLAISEESEYTTNSGRTPTNEVQEWIHSPGANLLAEHEGPGLTLGVDYTFVRNFYQQDLFDDENDTAGTADLLWHVLPERLDFNINHTRTQSAIRAIGAVTPDNLQETSNTTAGPLLRFNPRGEDELQFQYEWGDLGLEVDD